MDSKSSPPVPYEIRTPEGEVLRTGLRAPNGEIIPTRGEILWEQQYGEWKQMNGCNGDDCTCGVATEQPVMNYADLDRTEQPKRTPNIHAVESLFPSKGDSQGAPGEHGQYSSLYPQPVDVLDSWGVSWHIGDAIAYLARAPHKGGREDLEKAIWHIRKEINRLYGPKSL